MKWKVVIEHNETIRGTNGCHQSVHGYYKTKKEAERVAGIISCTYRETHTNKFAFVEKA